MSSPYASLGTGRGGTEEGPAGPDHRRSSLALSTTSCRLIHMIKAKTLNPVAAAGLFLYGLGVCHASDAVVMEIYQNCRLADISVIIEESKLSPEDSAEATARIAAVTSQDLEFATSRVIDLLYAYQIRDIELTRHGLGACDAQSSGKHVEAIATYCGSRLQSVDVLVNRETFSNTVDPDISLDQFLMETEVQLRQNGIFDQPLVSIENAVDCERDS